MAKKVSDLVLISAYMELRSIWKVGAEVGLGGQTVWERLRRLGVKLRHRPLSPEETSALRVFYSTIGAGQTLAQFAATLGRTPQFLSRQAGKLGLTTRHRPMSDAQRLAMSARATAWHKVNAHPKGASKGGPKLRVCPACGKFFPEVYAGSKVRYCSRRCARLQGPTEGRQGYSKSGKRNDLGGQYFRSRWEANYARYLNWLIDLGEGITKWEFEKETFEFVKIKKGTRFYTPDFRVTKADGSVEYHEVKGWRHPEGQTALKRMAKYYPATKIVVIDSDWFGAAVRQGLPAMIANWEYQRRGSAL